MVKKLRLLGNEDLSAIGQGLYIAAMIGCIQMFIDLLHYGEPFLQGEGSVTEWMMTLAAIGIVFALGAIITALFCMYITWHEGRSFKSISY